MTTHPQASSFEVKATASDEVRIRLDRPGVAAVSYTGQAEDLIERIAAAAGLSVTITPKEEA